MSRLERRHQTSQKPKHLTFARFTSVIVVVAAMLASLACAKRESGAGLNGMGVGAASPSFEAVAGVERGAPSPAAEMAVSAEAPAAPQAPASKATAPPSARQLIRTVSATIEARDPQGLAQKLQEKAGSIGGFVQSSSSHRLDDGSVRVELSLRVPSNELDALRVEARTLAARVISEQLATEDVTDQLIDLGARLKTLRATEGELQALLAASRAEKRKVEEIMAVYRELSEIRTQIEQIDAQQLGLERRVALSTLDLSIWPLAAARPLTSEEWRPLDTLRSSLGVLVNLLRAAGDFGIFAVVVLLPLGIVLWLLFWGARALWRRARRPR